GELLKTLEPAPGTRTDLQPRDGAGPRLTRKKVADAAGLSERQRKTAIRVANVPGADFEAAVEGDNPPTVTALAERGTNRRAEPTPEASAEARKRIYAEEEGHLGAGLPPIDVVTEPATVVTIPIACVPIIKAVSDALLMARMGEPLDSIVEAV